MARSKILVAAALAAPCLLGARQARALDPFLDVPDPAVVARSPASRYASMSDAEVTAELDRRKILYSRLDAAQAPGVRTPIRLTGRLHGVYIHSSLPPDQRVTSPFEILDARLALALDDFAGVLERHDIDEVVHYTMYRPNGGGSGRVAAASRVAPPAAPAARLHDEHGVEEPTFEVEPRPRAAARKSTARPSKSGAKTAPAAHKAVLRPSQDWGSPREPLREVSQKGAPDDAKPFVLIAPTKPPAAASRGARWKPGMTAAAAPAARAPYIPPPTTPAAPGTRHPAGLAIDVGSLHKKDGRWLGVGAGFHGRIGDKTCGDGANSPDDPTARELRAIVCEARDLGLFTYVLTPNYNAAHVDHFHMEIKAGVPWFLYH